jgi:hypothetical protein
VAGLSIDFCLLHWPFFENFQARFIVLSAPPNHFPTNRVYIYIYSHTLSISIQLFSHKTQKIRKSVVQNSSTEADRLSDSQEITEMLLNRNVRHRVYNSRPLYPILGQINPVHNFQTNFCKIDVNIIRPFASRFSRWVSFIQFSTSKTWMRLSSPRICHMFLKFCPP